MPKRPLHNAYLQDVVREVDARAVDQDVLDFTRETVENAASPTGKYTETITIVWRRRPAEATQ